MLKKGLVMKLKDFLATLSGEHKMIIDGQLMYSSEVPPAFLERTIVEWDYYQLYATIHNVFYITCE